MSDADVPSLGFVVGSADDSARLSVALRHSSCDSETEVMKDEEHGDVFQLGANIERPQPVTKSSAKDRHAAGVRPAPAQCKCTSVRVVDSVCPLVPKRLAIKVNFRQGRLVVLVLFLKTRTLVEQADRLPFLACAMDGSVVVNLSFAPVLFRSFGDVFNDIGTTRYNRH